jgi:hypothetical protein
VAINEVEATALAPFKISFVAFPVVPTEKTMDLWIAEDSGAKGRNLGFSDGSIQHILN